MILESTLTCPHCKHKETHTLEEKIVPVRYQCGGCHQSPRINAGDCCIYCVFGDYPCLQSQIEGASCCGSIN